MMLVGEGALTHDCFLLLGTNLGDRDVLLQQAAVAIQDTVGAVVDSSAIYESEPWGFASDQFFLNQVLRVSTSLSPIQLLDATQSIEKQLGRAAHSKSSGGRYSSRFIDIDILFVGQQVIATERLQVPHPMLHKRAFTLLPLFDIAPHWPHPVLGKDIATLLAECEGRETCWQRTV